MTAKFKSLHDLGDYVVVDDVLDCRVIAVRFFYADFPEYLVGWFSNGDAKIEWVSNWRLTAKQE